MEMLVVVAQHRNQYCSRVKPHGPARFESSPSRNFREINCRTFQSGAGILPNPLRSCSTPLTKRASYSSSPPSSFSSSPKEPSPTAVPHAVDITQGTTTVKSFPIPIAKTSHTSENSFSEELSYERGCSSFSELWAGPAYSNSPPPSSLPIPKFSLRPKRTVSLDLPASDPALEIHPMAKSAPASPTREHNISTREIFLSADSATKTLRRILNLDNAD
ncbi:uncharacterized protein LOC110821954 [Carica papaya]|uniref:uncharacterized protein LOC110821954 n=1 Tax=Carica papaya TaxID=3649 RepID=UPI000B8CD9C9|nr:uncharacterized protein LOC110821954 [Carica papaya]